MNDEEILKCLNDISEDEMIEKVIIPLYEKKFSKRFYDIEFTGKDKKEDQGIDITYYEISPDTKAKEYFGIQVKQGDINTGKGANGIAAISVQAQQAFTKKIPNVKDKSSYYIKTYIILTTGDIKAKAREQIVDQFKDKNFRFIDGKTLAEWIKATYLSEFMSKFNIEDEDDEVDEDESPIESIISFLEDEFKKDIKEIRASFRALDSCKCKIVRELMIKSPLKAFAIAKNIGMAKSSIEHELDELVREDVLEVDEDGYYVKYGNLGNWSAVLQGAELRINQLGYDSEIEIWQIVDGIFC
ncbi:restriction endonuclease [Clostridium omnivorum]|uniref:Restriction endonuclease type IV Mrr domain-containing protein n=1 Tax=Clostridium omnivorum TaxID=1604902 RepID=A0ABQ5N7G3_9CLOT|nr:restriction endonuclease [Clostridium sp. E14]GLC31136.1 hypothetical protein bsdE14_25460 [Clostridium sp. E14]